MVLTKLGFTISECYFIIANSFAIAGLIVASIGALNNSNKRIVDQAYNTKPMFMCSEKEEVKYAESIPEKEIRSTISETCNFSFGFILTAVGIWISAFTDTRRPQENGVLSVLILTVIAIIIVLGFAKIVTWWRANRIIEKLKKGKLAPSGGTQFLVDKED